MSYSDDFIDLKTFEIQAKIGKGKYSKVYEVANKKNGKKYVAKSLSDSFNVKRERIIDILHEVNITIKLNHPSIIKVYGYSPNNFKNDPNPVIIAEYAPNGSLYKIIHAKKTITKADNILNDTQILIIIYGIATAMSYLHSHNIVHRELDLTNIFLDDNYYPKISGFNISREISGIFVEKVSKVKGNLKYLAPEVFENLKYSKKSDVFSFSLILYELMTNKKYLEKIENKIEYIQKVYQEKSRPKIDESIPECYKKLIEACWS